MIIDKRPAVDYSPAIKNLRTRLEVDTHSSVSIGLPRAHVVRQLLEHADVVLRHAAENHEDLNVLADIIPDIQERAAAIRAEIAEAEAEAAAAAEAVQ